jgi:hypothetical protein
MTEAQKTAHSFLSDLESHLNSWLPGAIAIRNEIATSVRDSKALPKGDPGRRSAFPEGAFLNDYILPRMNQYLREHLDLAADDARRALLSESFRAQPTLSSGSPVRSIKHPFRKVIGVSPRQVMRMWRGETSVPALAMNSCPDLALRAPAPHNIVFEAKYFTMNGITSAETGLVRDIYQAFFYLGLPGLPETKRSAGWNYDFACVLAYDASRDAVLVEAWRSLPAEVREACWDGANVYVMILRGAEPPPSSVACS